MADIRVTRGSKLVFTAAPNDDLVASVRRGFGPPTPVQHGDALPTDHNGVWLVRASDHQNRAVTITLSGETGKATPPSTASKPSASVWLTYEVAP